jgi:hypothetical protein
MIFDLTTAYHADGDRSGVVPGVVDGGHALRSCQGRGGEKGLDCASKFLVKILFAKVEDHFIIYVLLKVLYLKLPAVP